MADRPDRYEWQEEETGELLVKDKRFDPPTVTRLTPEAIAGHDLTFLVVACTQGRDVTGITRVTGYFSKTSGWNPSKVGELKDRYRVKIGGDYGRG